MSDYRKAAYAAYPHRCDLCAKPKQGPYSLQVHHRDLDPTNDDVANLQVLCPRCHNRIHIEAGQHEKLWATRHATGGFGNEPAIRPDGTLRPDTYRTEPETGCRIWLMSLRGTTPQCAHNGTIVNVRRELWRLHRGEPIPDNVGASCENAACVAIEHLLDGRTWSGIGVELRDYIEAASPILAAGAIATRIGLSEQTVSRHIARSGSAQSRSHHRLVRAFPIGNLPSRPPSISDRQWAIFTAAYGRTLEDAGVECGITRQRVDQVVKRVLAILDSEELAAVR